MQERHVEQDIAILTMTRAELRQFVHEGVLAALSDPEVMEKICRYCTEQNRFLERNRVPYIPQNVEYKSTAYAERGIPIMELPEWVREGNGERGARDGTD